MSDTLDHSRFQNDFSCKPYTMSPLNRYIVLSNRKRTGEIRTIFDDRGSVLFMAEDERLTSAYENEAAVAELS